MLSHDFSLSVLIIYNAVAKCSAQGNALITVSIEDIWAPLPLRTSLLTLLRAFFPALEAMVRNRSTWNP